MPYLKCVSILVLSTLLVCGCAHKPKEMPSDIPAFDDTPDVIAPNINKIRYSMLRDTAISTGAQAGLAYRSRQINWMLERDIQNMDRTFNFRALMLKNYVLPPVLSVGIDNLNLDNPNAIRLADRVYKIESPPRFVTAPPTWRDYVWMDYQQPEKPDSSLLPRNANERLVWNHYVLTGWEEGIKQADQIFSINLGRLKRDYNGMILYRTLLAQKMVTAPFVAQANLGVTGNANEMRINDQILRITATSKLQPNPKHWKAIITPGYDP